MAIADRIGVMESGHLVQIGSAESLYRHPASRFVAGFIGKCNFLEGRVVAPQCFETADGSALRFEGPQGIGPAAFCIRPEHLRLEPAPAPGGVGLVATVSSLTYLGPLSELEAHTAAGERLLVHLASTTAAPVETGQRIHLGWSAQDAFVV